MNPQSSTESLDRIRPEILPVIENMERVIVGKRLVIEQLICALLCDGHVLLDDVPGVGKTTLAKALAASIGLSYRRIQFTPDLLPTDVTGVSIFHPAQNRFEFQPGPIFAHLVLADEINRTSPRTQSALLEVMEEGQVTVDGVTRPLERPFMVIATENPIEYEGTFPLPESQLDRFLFRLKMGYPTVAEEARILSQVEKSHPLGNITSILGLGDLARFREDVTQVHIAEAVQHYMVQIAQATRRHPKIYLGMSPRATIALQRGAQAWAYLHSRDYVVPDDIRILAPQVIQHRLILHQGTRGEQEALVHDILEEILTQLPAPTVTP